MLCPRIDHYDVIKWITFAPDNLLLCGSNPDNQPCMMLMILSYVMQSITCLVDQIKM